MTTAEFTLRFHEGVEAQLAAHDRSGSSLVAGAWKFWILHPRIAERGAVNYGFWDKRKKPPSPIQNVSARHDESHYDYSQLLQPIKRMARRASTGEPVDLIEYIASSDRVAAMYLEQYKPGAAEHGSESFVSPDDTRVDLLKVLTAAGVRVKPANGWNKRGRLGFTPEGIMLHHTAGPKSGDAPSLSTCINGRSDLPGPLCHIVLGRSGTAHLIAANIANHAGRGAKEVLDLVRRDEPMSGDAKDHRYKDALVGNQFFYGIEVENAGVHGDPYPEEQIDALVGICAAICSAHGWTANRVVHHRQWTSRKPDMSYGGDLPGLVAQKMNAPVLVKNIATSGHGPRVTVAACALEEA